MKPNKPDRFERMVEEYTMPDDVVDKDDVVKLLCAQHQAMVRMVKKELKANIINQENGDHTTDYIIATHGRGEAMSRHPRPTQEMEGVI